MSVSASSPFLSGLAHLLLLIQVQPYCAGSPECCRQGTKQLTHSHDPKASSYWQCHFSRALIQGPGYLHPTIRVSSDGKVQGQPQSVIASEALGYAKISPVRMCDTHMNTCQYLPARICVQSTVGYKHLLFLW